MEEEGRRQGCKGSGDHVTCGSYGPDVQWDAVTSMGAADSMHFDGFGPETTSRVALAVGID
eukprot:702581-Rhodomonas_salina.1